MMALQTSKRRRRRRRVNLDLRASNSYAHLLSCSSKKKPIECTVKRKLKLRTAKMFYLTRSPILLLAGVASLLLVVLYSVPIMEATGRYYSSTMNVNTVSDKERTAIISPSFASNRLASNISDQRQSRARYVEQRMLSQTDANDDNDNDDDDVRLNERQDGAGFIKQQQATKLDSFEFRKIIRPRSFISVRATKLPTAAKYAASPSPAESESSSQRSSRYNRAVPSSRYRSMATAKPTSTSARSARASSRRKSQSAARPKVLQSQGRKCALILQRTYVKKVLESSSSFVPPGSQDLFSNDYGGEAGGTINQALQPTGKLERICLTYDDVNQAISEAKQRRNFVPVADEEVNSIEPSRPVIAELGELNQEVTKILAQRFDMSQDEISNGLPLIDMSRTDFWPLCPLMVKPVECDSSGRFRSFTGHCNNLKNPSWGAAQTPFVRYLAPKHPDGIQAERSSVVDGSPLPSPRLVSSIVHRDFDQPSSDLSLMIMVWGQIIDHDVALAAPPRDEQGMDFNCCKRQHPNCKPIEIPERDPFYSRFNQRCMDFKRSLAGLRPNCALGPRVHINTITSTIDANTIYGSTKAVADQLRTFSGGLLKVQDVFRNSNLKPLLPKQIDKPDLDCFARPKNTFCFLGGDERVNEQPTLTVIHTLYVRDHNRLANELAALNPHWDDDRIYHETRHIQAAIIQNVLINEYLPLLIGRDMMVLFNLTAAPPGTYWKGYNPDVTPAISQGFSTAAFRQGHTFIQGRMDQVIAGILNTPAQLYDPFITEEISGHLFQEPGLAYGMDLPAINLARGREQGTPGYTAFREWCGLLKVETFEDLQPYMSNMTAFLYSKLYRHVDDIDLWSGGVSERRMAGSQIGPTFACIIAKQFANIKRGDRFWFENANLPSSFTLDQIREIRGATLTRLLCYNSDNLLTIQQNALKLPHPIYNPRIRCADVPDLDLNFWREEPANPGIFMTSSANT